MGIGDELMMAGEARKRAAGSRQKFLMHDKRGQPKWHPVWEGNPNIARQGEPFDGVIGFTNGLRPYIVETTPDRFTFRAYTPAPAYLPLTSRALELKRAAEGAVIFNPTIKPRASPNKQWGLWRWQRLVTLTRDLRWLCIGEPAGMPRIQDAKFMPTMSFMDACGYLAGARAAVLHEGGLHHAAAALGVPAIVIHGGFISPRVTGYAGQVAMYEEDERWPYGCGQRVKCEHCAEAMNRITPELVAAALRELLKKQEEAVPA